MIGLDECDNSEKKYAFPAFDFLFRNTGSAAALMWKFRVVVSEVEIDPKPEFKFWASVDKECLYVAVRDDGWGPSRDFKLEVGESCLNRLFQAQHRTFTGPFAGGDERKILTVSVTEADWAEFSVLLNEQRAAIENQLKKYERLASKEGSSWMYEFRKRELIPFPDCPDTLIISSDNGGYVSQPIEASTSNWSGGTLMIRWQCLDGEYSGRDRVSHPYTTIGLTQSGFVQSYPEYPAGAALHSDTVYAAIIDPSIGPHEREYSVARNIPPGDVDRFHIMIGATTSCTMRVNVEFFIDDDTAIPGKEDLVLKIWNPRDKAYHERYKDGEEVHQYM